LTFGQLFEYKDLKLRIPRGLRCAKKGIITMPNNRPKCKNKTRIDASARRALKEIGKIAKALKPLKSLELELGLKNVDKELHDIMDDHHFL
jgi:hypothetical protein